MDDRIRQLPGIYAAFDAETAAFREAAACRKGCAFCCTDAGAIHMTTLEGLVIRERLNGMPKPRRRTLEKALGADMKKREQKQPSACPFLMKNMACAIYDIRPFACRRIHSVHACGKDAPPTLSRQVMAAADQTIQELQRLDDTGYAGHMSYILYMLDQPKFLSVYLAGDHKPEEITAFGKKYKIIINKSAVGP